jgi:predicted NAD/FAD-binding protein
MTKQTSGNNLFLARVKTVYNGPTYREAMALMNDSGVDTTRKYVLSLGSSTDANLDKTLASVIDTGYAGKRDRLPRILR